jgi:hypothetical protein
MNGTGGGAGGTMFDADATLARLAREMTEPPFHDVLKPQPVSVDADGRQDRRRGARRLQHARELVILPGGP